MFMILNSHSKIIHHPNRIYCVGLFFSFFGGTGSYPPLHNGLHLKILYIDSRAPLSAPCVSIASMAYAEQVGVNLQQEIFFGEMFF